MSVRVVAALALGFLVAGCVATGPTNPEDFQVLVTEATPRKYGSILFTSPAEWLPDQYGITASDNSRQGAFVLTDTSLIFLQWLLTYKNYKVVYRAAYSDIGSYGQLKHGESSTIAIAAKDHRSQTFNMIGGAGVLADQEASEKALTIMNQKIPVAPAPLDKQGPK